MYCLHCGKEIPENSSFCRYCGAGTAGAKPAVKTAEVMREDYSQNNYTRQNDFSQNEYTQNDSDDYQELLRNKLEIENSVKNTLWTVIGAFGISIFLIVCTIISAGARWFFGLGSAAFTAVGIHFVKTLNENKQKLSEAEAKLNEFNIKGGMQR